MGEHAPAVDPGAHCLPTLQVLRFISPTVIDHFFFALDFLSDLIWCYLWTLRALALLLGAVCPWKVAQHLCALVVSLVK